MKTSRLCRTSLVGIDVLEKVQGCCCSERAAATGPVREPSNREIFSWDVQASHMPRCGVRVLAVMALSSMSAQAARLSVMVILCREKSVQWKSQCSTVSGGDEEHRLHNAAALSKCMVAIGASCKRSMRTAVKFRNATWKGGRVESGDKLECRAKYCVAL